MFAKNLHNGSSNVKKTKISNSGAKKTTIFSSYRGGIRKNLSGSLPKYGIFQQKRKLHMKALSEVEARKNEKAVIYELKNDKKSNQTRDWYKKYSLKQFYDQLQADKLYLYVDKAVATKDIIEPGHVALFITDSDKQVILDSCMSLRNAKPSISGKQLIYDFDTGLTTKKGSNPIWKVKFIDIKTEFEEYLLHYAVDDKDPIEDKRRFLVELPLNIVANTADEIVYMVQEAQASLGDAEYILLDGTVNGEQRKSLNCINGFYRGLGLEGTVPNPSPQMAVSSVLKLILGEERVNKLIEGTGLKQKGIERVFDDELKASDSSTSSLKPNS